jgi:predicted protein tyrosine phosphatase
MKSHYFKHRNKSLDSIEVCHRNVDLNKEEGKKYKSKIKVVKKEHDRRDDILPEIDKISDKIFLGNYEAAKSKDILKNKGITHIITVGMEMDPMFEDDFEYLVIRARDSEDEKIFEHFYECFEFIEKSGKTFIHCREGISRSATITIAYLMWKNEMSLREGLKLVMKKRRKINPNNGFLKQLKIFEKSLKKFSKNQND